MYRYKLTRHARDQMERRGVDEEDVRFALGSVAYTTPGNQNSRCIVGVPNEKGNDLKVVIVGDVWPPIEPLIVKTVAWRGDE